MASQARKVFGAFEKRAPGSLGPISRRFRNVFGPGKLRTKLTFMQSLMPIHCFLFEIQIIKIGFTGPISYRVFRETGPWSEIKF